jgi:hypothetical protein
MANFQQLFPTFLQKCAELHELLRIVAFMLFIVGSQYSPLGVKWASDLAPLGLVQPGAESRMR